jgi:hypothetical protein
MTMDTGFPEITYAFFWDNLKQIRQDEISAFDRYLLPGNRSSTIFPIYKKNSTASLMFLSYWLRKHNTQVVVKFTARDLFGRVVGKDWMAVWQYKSITYSADCFDYFKSSADGFCGSIEVEVFSKSPPQYRFPAITLSYQDSNSCSVVHSCIRSYNESEVVNDYALNFPQTGFDVVFADGCRNYVCFFGGTKPEYNLTLLLEDERDQTTVSFKLDNLNVGQLHLIYVEDLFCNFNAKRAAKLSIFHDLDVFPRFYVGIIKDDFVPTLTHSFFDTSEKNHDGDTPLLYLRAENIAPKKNYDSAFMIPIYPAETFKTSIMTYGQNLSHASEIFLTIFSDSGELITQRRLDQQEGDSWNRLSTFDVGAFTTANCLSADKKYSLHIGFTHNSEKPFPARFKLALNVNKIEADLGSNICFAPLVLSEFASAKPFTRRWFPLGGKEGFVASVHNTSFSTNDDARSTVITCEFINHLGGILTRTTTLTNNASVYLNVIEDDELRTFFAGETGWCLVNSQSYSCDSYYFSTSGLQIGGDHAY